MYKQISTKLNKTEAQRISFIVFSAIYKSTTQHNTTQPNTANADVSLTYIERNVYVFAIEVCVIRIGVHREEYMHNEQQSLCNVMLRYHRINSMQHSQTNEQTLDKEMSTITKRSTQTELNHVRTCKIT